jgi:signal transduction histidine kinase
MRARLWPAVAVSFGALILLSIVFALLVSTKASRIHERTRTAHQIYRQADDAISDIQANINKGALLEQSGFNDPSRLDTENRISGLEINTRNDLKTLTRLMGASQRRQIFALQLGLDQYWVSIRQSLTTSRTRSGRQKLFTELENQPEKVLDLAGRMDALNQANLARQEEEGEAQQTKLRKFAVTAAFILLLLEFAIAIFSTAYMLRLDYVSEAERKRAEKAEQELRHLSNQLVRVQEEERKTISRELHDEVGQILTGLRMELGTLSHYKPDEEYRQRLESVKRLAEEALRSVRNLALLVRPSMLDDLGLEPALHWQVKQFSRRCGIPVTLNIEGNLDNLPEALRLCLYRAIQEAMTNSVKHAEASHVSVAVKQEETRVTASVQDDGKGFDVDVKSSGLGLLGMTERVRALHGRMSVLSTPGSGTRIHLELPAITSGLPR